MSPPPQPDSGATSSHPPQHADAFQRALLECADYAIISTGPDGVIRTFNRAAERMLGHRAEEVIGQVTPEIFHDREEVALRAAELTEELGRPVPAGVETLVAKTRLGRPYEQEWTWIGKDGSRLPVQLSMTAMLDDAGQLIGFLGIAHDITRRREAQARVRQLTTNLEQRVEERTTQLATSQQRYETLATTVPVGIYHCDPAGQCSFVNQRWCDLTGLKLADALGGGWSRAVHPEDCQRVVDEWTRAVREERPFQLEYRYRTPAGATVWAYGQAVAERDASGRIVSYVGTVTDITELKAAQAALQGSSQRFQLVVEASPSGILMVNRAGRIVLVNAQTERLFGYTRQELVGQPMDLLVPDRVRPGHAAHRASFFAAPGVRAMGAGRDLFARRKDGSEFPVEIGLNPIQTEEGMVVLGTIVDITERKRAEVALQQAHDHLEERVAARTAELGHLNTLLFTEIEERKAVEAALRDGEARLRTIIDSTPDWIFIKDEQHRYQMVNESYARARGLPLEDVLGKNDLELGQPAELVTGDPAKGIRGYWADDREVMDTGEMKIIPEEPGIIAGEPVFLSTVKVPLRDATGKVTGVLGYVRDITERKAMEAELRSREDQLRDLFENATDLIQSVTPDGRILFVNRAWLNSLGYTMGELAALNLYDLLHPGCVTECRAQFARTMQGEALDNVPAIFRAKDGREIHVEGNASCRFENGRPVATRAIFRDITLRKMVEAERERLIRELQAAVAEVKTLSGLLPVCGWCKKIRDDSGYWNSVEGYLTKSSGVDITHGICPECEAKMMADLEKVRPAAPPEAPPARLN